MKPVVIILHGIFRTSWSMKLYEIALRLKGFDVLNITYPSLRYELEQIGTVVGKKILASKKVIGAPEIHFLTHSMGGVVTRYVLNLYPELRAKTTNVVMLVPPSQGSEMADFATNTSWTRRIFRLFYGPAGQQLTTRYASNYPSLSGNIGIIAGSKNGNPLARRVFGADTKHDGTISHDRMTFEGVTGISEVMATHNSILCSPTAIKKAVTFIKTGTF